MFIYDKIYGKFNITEPLIVKLIKSPSIQRLKDISQFGVPNEFYHLKGYSRFEHSIGVMLLLKILNASRTEQIAGLLHDVSHTAFSHVYDWMLGRGETEDYQDKVHQKQIVRSNIGKLLKSYGFDPKYITDFGNFPLLDAPIPNLCADRIDYALREFPLKTVKQTLQSLTISKNQIVFNNKISAKIFAVNFLKCQKQHWGGFEAVNRYMIFAEVLKMAVSANIISKSDFTGSEQKILTKIKKNKNQKIQTLLSLLRYKSLSYLPKSAKISHKKFRFVDPRIANEKGKYLSEIDESFKKMIAQAEEENEKGMRVVRF